MLDVAPTELLLVALVALVVIGPKDLPRLMRTVGYWVGRARGVARHFRAGMDEMMRQAEVEEMEKRWAAENERIMREHPASEAGAPTLAGAETAPPVSPPMLSDLNSPPRPPEPIDPRVHTGPLP